jgi:hypothetical protein
VAAPAATVHSASDVTASTTLLAADAASLSAELATPATPFHYTLTDTAPNLVAAATAVVTGATSVTISGPATVAEATTLHVEAALSAYSIVDAATTLASALSS